MSFNLPYFGGGLLSAVHNQNTIYLVHSRQKVKEQLNQLWRNMQPTALSLTAAAAATQIMWKGNKQRETGQRGRYIPASEKMKSTTSTVGMRWALGLTLAFHQIPQKWQMKYKIKNKYVFKIWKVDAIIQKKIFVLQYFWKRCVKTGSNLHRNQI